MEFCSRIPFRTSIVIIFAADLVERSFFIERISLNRVFHKSGMKYTELTYNDDGTIKTIEP